MIKKIIIKYFIVILIPLINCVYESSSNAYDKWYTSQPVLLPGLEDSFDEIAVKDPSIVYYEGKWHIFYTARNKSQYFLGYVSAPNLNNIQNALRHKLFKSLGDNYAAAPQIFYFAPHKKWYLIFQSKKSNYQPVYSTSNAIDEPLSWTPPKNIVNKTESNKWIDFWVICDESFAYFFYTRDQNDQYVMTTRLEDFPEGFDNPRKVYSDLHEAAHIYKIKGKKKYYMICEISDKQYGRYYSLAASSNLLGRWIKKEEIFADGKKLHYKYGDEKWTELVSHGELIRSGYNQKMEIEDKNRIEFLIQGLTLKEYFDISDYVSLPWRLGIIRNFNRNN